MSQEQLEQKLERLDSMRDTMMKIKGSRYTNSVEYFLQVKAILNAMKYIMKGMPMMDKISASLEKRSLLVSFQATGLPDNETNVRDFTSDINSMAAAGQEIFGVL